MRRKFRFGKYSVLRIGLRRHRLSRDRTVLPMLAGLFFFAVLLVVTLMSSGRREQPVENPTRREIAAQAQLLGGVWEGTFGEPIKGYHWRELCSSDYGMRSDPFSRTKARVFHGGIDLAAPEGTTVCAVGAGVVTVSRYAQEGYGNRVAISHGNGISTLYAHCDSLLVSEGDRVAAGDSIATVGATGNVTGPHLHFEVLQGSMPQDPTDWLP